MISHENGIFIIRCDLCKTFFVPDPPLVVASQQDLEALSKQDGWITQGGGDTCPDCQPNATKPAETTSEDVASSDATSEEDAELPAEKGEETQGEANPNTSTEANTNTQTHEE
jgi:hypothetical protein